MRVIDKYLDKYYARKLIHYLDEFINVTYYLDRRYIFENDYVEIDLKKPDAKEYNVIYLISYDSALYKLMNFKDFTTKIKKIIKETIE